MSSSGITTLPAAAASWVACGFIMCSKVNDSFESQLQMGRRLFVPIIGFGFEPLTLKPSHRPTTFNAGPTRRGRDAERTKITNHSSKRCRRYAYRTELASTDSGFDGTSRSRFCRSSTRMGGSVTCLPNSQHEVSRVRESLCMPIHRSLTCWVISCAGVSRAFRLRFLRSGYWA